MLDVKTKQHRNKSSSNGRVSDDGASLSGLNHAPVGGFFRKGTMKVIHDHAGLFVGEREFRLWSTSFDGREQYEGKPTRQEADAIAREWDVHVEPIQVGDIAMGTVDGFMLVGCRSHRNLCTCCRIEKACRDAAYNLVHGGWDFFSQPSSESLVQSIQKVISATFIERGF